HHLPRRPGGPGLRVVRPDHRPAGVRRGRLSGSNVVLEPDPGVLTPTRAGEPLGSQAVRRATSNSSPATRSRSDARAGSKPARAIAIPKLGFTRGCYAAFQRIHQAAHADTPVHGWWERAYGVKRPRGGRGP